MSSLFGGGGGASQAAGITQEALDQYKQLQLPDIEKMKLYLEQYQSQGQLDPILETAVQQGDTRLSDVTLDPRLRSQYMNALEQMSGISQTGMTDIDRAAMSEMLRQSASEEAAQRKSILENRAARGMGGSGDELAAALAASQGSANRANSAAMAQAAQAMQNRLNAVNQTAQMSQAIEQSDYAKQAAQANQRDAIAQFNAQLAAGAQQRNVGQQNTAQQANLQQAQSMSNANVDMRNQQQQYNKELLQQQYQNQLARLAGMSGQYTNLANATANAAAQQAKAKQQGMAGLGTLAGAGIGFMAGGPTGIKTGAELGAAGGGILGSL